MTGHRVTRPAILTLADAITSECVSSLQHIHTSATTTTTTTTLVANDDNGDDECCDYGDDDDDINVRVSQIKTNKPCKKFNSNKSMLRYFNTSVS